MSGQTNDGSRPVRVLLVEDEMIVLEDLRRRIRSMGYEVVALATTGEEAVQQAVAHAPDVVVMDISLHGAMDGVEAAAKIYEATGIPVVFVTGLADPETMERARMTPVFAFVLKPVDDRELKYTIELTLRRRSMTPPQHGTPPPS